MPDETHDAQHVRDDLTGGLEALIEAVNEGDMGKVTWFALAVAERAQHWAHRTVSLDDTTEARKFYSMEGLLVDVTGAAITADGSRFPHLAKAFTNDPMGGGEQPLVDEAAKIAAQATGGPIQAIGEVFALQDLVMLMSEVLADVEGDWRRAHADDELAAQWAAAEPETRAAILVHLAWTARGADMVREEGAGSMYADQLVQFAAEFTEGSEAFHGVSYPVGPLPRHPAATMAVSIAFDRDDLGAGRFAALKLMSYTPEPEDFDDAEGLDDDAQPVAQTTADDLAFMISEMTAGLTAFDGDVDLAADHLIQAWSDAAAADVRAAALLGSAWRARAHELPAAGSIGSLSLRWARQLQEHARTHTGDVAGFLGPVFPDVLSDHSAAGLAHDLAGAVPGTVPPGVTAAQANRATLIAALILLAATDQT